MRKMLRMTLAMGLIVASTQAGLADGKNWTAEKAAQIDTNRTSNAGLGDGGERFFKGTWQGTIYGEDGPMDMDPGNSGSVNQVCQNTLLALFGLVDYKTNDC